MVRAGLTGVPFAVNPRSSFCAKARAILAIAATLALVHCDAKKDPPATAKLRLGEPLGVRVDDVTDANGNKLGNISGAFAITKGQAAEPLVPGMARALDRVAKRCPALVAKGAEGMHLVGKLSG